MASAEELAEEMGTLFDSRDDETTASNTVSALDSARALCSQHETHVREIVSELALSVESFRYKASTELPNEEAKLDNDADALRCQSESEHARLQQLDKQAQQLKSAQSHAHARLQRARDEEASLDAMLAHDFPKAKHELGMYAHVSQVSLEHSPTTEHQQHSNHEHALTGRVHLPGSDVFRLELDPSTMTDFAITNSIWDAIAKGVHRPA
jgi:Skp family chaperone for outer membrane proteins